MVIRISEAAFGQPDPRKSPLYGFVTGAISRAAELRPNHLTLWGMGDCEPSGRISTILAQGPITVGDMTVVAAVKNGFLVSQAWQRGAESPVQEPVKMLMEYQGSDEEGFFRSLQGDPETLANFLNATQNVLLIADPVIKEIRDHIFNLFRRNGVITVSDFDKLDILKLRLMEYQLELINFYNPGLKMDRVDELYSHLLQEMKEIAAAEDFVIYAHIGATKANIFFGPPNALLLI